MTDETISYICKRSAELQKGKTLTELSHSEAMKTAWKEIKTQKTGGLMNNDRLPIEGISEI